MMPIPRFLRALGLALLAFLVLLPPATAQLIQTIAGNGTAGFNGDGSPGNQLNDPFGVAVDSNGVVYIADTANNRIRAVNPSASTVTVANVLIPAGSMATIAGNGTAGFSGDGGPATAAQINQPIGVAVDSAGDIYIADLYNYRVRKVNSGGIITTVTGRGTSTFGGDNGPAINATLYPYAIAVDKVGNLYIGDTINQRVRVINTGSNVITVGNVAIQPGFIATVAGNGIGGSDGDGGPATSAELDYPYSIAVDNQGNIYICDTYNRKMRVVNTGTSSITVAQVTIQPGNIATIAGDGSYGYRNSGLATQAEFADPDGIAVDALGNVYISDLESESIRLIDARTGLIQTIAGIGGQYGYNGDNIPATTAYLSYPRSLAIDPAGNIYFVDQPNERIRKIAVDPNTAAITTPNSASFVEGMRKNVVVLANYWPTPKLTLAGTLPAGLNFSDNGDGSATLGGTPAANARGVYNLFLTATNGLFPPVVQAFTLTVYAPGSVSLSSASTLIAKDAGTGGNWLGTYGSDGYAVANAGQILPLYATFSVRDQQNYTWTSSTADSRALLQPGGSGRIAAAWYSDTSFSMDLDLGSTAHEFSLYALDWGYDGRIETVQVIDAVSGFLLDNEIVSNFASGLYLSWNVTGHVRIVVTVIRGRNAVISGAFFAGSSGSSTLTSFVVSKTLGTLRNDYSGWVGMAFRTSGLGISVSALGRYVVLGNSESHTLKIVDGSTGVDVPGASITVATASATPGTFQYGALNTPVALAPNTTYYLLSQERYGGDQWYDYDTTVQTTTFATAFASVYGTGSPYTTTGKAGQTYVPVDFQYATGSNPPVITQQPQNITVTLGQTATFTVSAASGTVVTYQWQYRPVGASNFTNIPGATSSTYTTPAAQASDDGSQYLCIVGNAAGSVLSTAATLAVTPPSPPAIVQQPQSATVSVGQSATFRVTASGTGLTYQWRSLPPGGAIFTDIPAATASAYTTPSAQASDNGTQFECVISNAGGSVTSTPATLTLRAPGGATQFVTSVIPGTVRNNYTGWVGMAITVGPNPITVNALGRFVIPGNSGSHIVKLVDAATGSDLSGGSVSIPVTGVLPGNFSYVDLPVPVILSANARYYVVTLESVGGDQWYDHDTIVQTTNAATVFSGVYSSNGSNWVLAGSLGQIYGPVDFEYGATSNSPPVITQQPQDATVIAGQGAVFSVSVTSGTAVSYQWKSQAPGAQSFVNISGATGSSYTTPPAALSDTGTQFLCVITNGVGSVSTNSTTLTVQAPSAATPFIRSTTLGSLRNNYAGWVGMSISVSVSPLTVTALGRIFVSGNTGTHLLKIVNATTGADVPNGSVPVSMSNGAPGSFIYATLPNPVTLNANTTYYVLTQEMFGGDQWYDYSNTSGATNWVASLTGSVYGTASPYTVVPGSAGQMYGPVDFKYSVPPIPYIINAALGTLRNNFSGWVGMSITIGRSPITITQLGRMVAPGNAASHIVKIVNASGSDVAGGSVSVTTSGTTTGRFAYANLNAPVTLNPSTTYYIVTQETSGGDLWYDLDTALQTVPVASLGGAVYSGGSSYISTSGTIGHAYGPVDFRFQ